MTVNDLILKLENMPVSAIVCLEVSANPIASEVYLCTKGNESLVYITDDFSNIREEFTEDGYLVEEVDEFED